MIARSAHGRCVASRGWCASRRPRQSSSGQAGSTQARAPTKITWSRPAREPAAIASPPTKARTSWSPAKSPPGRFGSPIPTTSPSRTNAFFGLLLRPEIPQLPDLTPGDWVEAQGIIAKRAGLPILLPRDCPPLAPCGRARSQSGHAARPGVLSLHGRAGDSRKHRHRREPEWRRGSALDRPAEPTS